MNPLDRTKKSLAAFDGERPLDRAATIPSSWYIDPEIYESERDRVFGASWQCVGRTQQLSRPGDYVTLEVAGEPLVMVRDEQGQLRAFANVCRHRAARVAIGECGHSTRFRCRYHGWTYDLEGRLKGVPESDGIREFERSDFSLPPYRVAAFGPLVFVAMSERAGDFADFIRPLSERLNAAELATLQFFERKTYDIDCNWKVYVDNYLDGGYHVNTIHPGLAGVLDYSQYRTELFDSTNVQLSPLTAPDAKSSDVGLVRTGDWAQYWWLFPNFMMNMYSGVMDTNLVLPLGPDRCRVIFDFYFAKTATDTDRSYAAQSICVADQIQAEDVEICEEVQRGLASRTFDVGRFMPRREAGGYHFHRLLAARLRGGAPLASSNSE